MEAIILAGGFGTRLKAVVPDLPKPMAPVAGRPFLEILITSLARKGFTRVILSLGHMAERVVGHFGTHYDNVELVYEIESKPLGTGGAICAAMRHCQLDHVFVFNGDTFLDLEIRDIEQEWTINHQPIIVALEVKDTSRYGRILIESGCVKGFLEKGTGGPGLINAGCYVLPRHFLDEMQLGKPFSFENDFLTAFTSTKRMDAFISKGYFIDIGVPQEYRIAQSALKNFT